MAKIYDLKEPLVTVYMPTHNRGILIRRAVESVLNQTYRNIELIICVDGSTDETIDILREYCSRDARLKYLVNDKPEGACFARNRCIDLAKGEFITGLDDDDEFTADRIDVFIQHYFTTQNDILTTSRLYKNESSLIIGDVYQGEINKEMMGNANLIGNQVFTRTEYLRELMGFDVNFPAWQDYDMWYRLVSKYGNCYKLSKPTYIFYVDENRPRITTGSRAFSGYQMFVKKHKKNLSRKQLKNLAVQDLLNRSQPVTLVDLARNVTLNNVIIYAKYKLKKISFIKFLYNSFNSKRKFG